MADWKVLYVNLIVIIKNLADRHVSIRVHSATQHWQYVEISTLPLLLTVLFSSFHLQANYTSDNCQCSFHIYFILRNFKL